MTRNPALNNIRIPRLGRNRLGVFFVRFPSYVDDQGRRRVVQKSLRTKNPAEARLLALRFCLHVATGRHDLATDPRHGVSPWTVNFGTGEFAADGEDDHRRMMEFVRHASQNQALFKPVPPAPPTVIVQAPPVARAGAPLSPLHAEARAAALAALAEIDGFAPPADDKSLKAAFALHIEREKRAVKSSNTVREKEVVFRDFMNVFGEDCGLNAITAEHVTTRWIPVELSRPNQKADNATLSLSRLEKRRSYLSKFFQWAKKAGLYRAESPVQVQMGTKKEIRAQTESYAEFTADDLSMIFSHKYAGSMNKPDWYWIPLLGLFSGARLSELCDLSLADFSIVEGTEVFEIRDGKTAESRRVVPVHSALLGLGLWRYVEAQRTRGATHLISHRPIEARDKSVGRQFGVWLDAAGISDSRKVFHSFRSTAITDMHNSAAGAAAIRKAVGHTSAALAGEHGNYVRGMTLRTLKAAIEQLAFPSIDFSLIKLSDPTFQAFFDAHKALINSASYRSRQERKAAHEAAVQRRLERNASAR